MAKLSNGKTVKWQNILIVKLSNVKTVKQLNCKMTKFKVLSGKMVKTFKL